MKNQREIHADFQYYLKYKEQELIDLYTGLRAYILEVYPESNELLYHTHALTSVFSVSEKMGDGFCTVPIYTNHLNLAFNKGTLLNDPKKLLQGTGKLMRHIPISSVEDYKSENVKQLILSAITLSIEDSNGTHEKNGLTISKIKH
tara:strand:+ start:93655 stop:94092 length:438 start_codon:yes stop_codon:yes gene_type:complete